MRRAVAVALNNVDKSYGRQSIFKKLNLEIPASQFTVLLGKNGSGKSTFLRLIAGMESADAGEIFALGTDIEQESVLRRQQTSFVSEQIGVDPSYELHRLVEMCASLQPNWNSSELDKFLSLFKLSLEKKFGTLSRGQRIQFFFSLAAASKPKLYLLDEVTSVLDANARFEVMNHLRNEVSRGATVVLATNIAAEVHNFANEIVFLVNHQVGLRCSVEELQKRFRKFRVSESSFIPPRHCRPVQLNRDGSISYLMPAGVPEKVLGTEDQRGITIEDVFIYFTGPEAR